MTKELRDLRARMEPTLRAYGVTRASVFGSWARGEAGVASDVDVLVQFEEGRSLLDLVGLEQDLSDELGMKADVVTFASVHPLLRDQVLRDQVPLFG
jgi:predicted nucleotidyltransferase